MSFTGATFKALIAAHINRTDQTNLIVTACNLATKRLSDMGFWFQETSGTLTTVAATNYVAFPSGFVKEVPNSLRSVSNGYSLEKIPFENIDYLLHVSTSTQEPYYYAMADKVYLYPKPNAIYALPWKYYVELAFPIDGLSNAWTDEVWDLTFWSVLAEVWQYLGNSDELTKAAARQDDCLKRHQNRQGLIEGTGRIRATRF